MPFSILSERYPFIETARRLRQNPVSAYGVAIIAVAAATALRPAIPGQTVSPFLTYYPAILIATLFGGLWPGALSVGLSSIAAWSLFMPAPDLGVPNEQMMRLLLFVVVSAMRPTRAAWCVGACLRTRVAKTRCCSH